VVTLALNVADPLVAGEYGKAAFDAVFSLESCATKSALGAHCGTKADLIRADAVEIPSPGVRINSPARLRRRWTAPRVSDRVGND
jgi:hypothetical protein